MITFLWIIFAILAVITLFLTLTVRTERNHHGASVLYHFSSITFALSLIPLAVAGVATYGWAIGLLLLPAAFTVRVLSVFFI